MKRLKKFIICILSVCLFIASLTACSDNTADTNADSAEVSVVTTIFPIYDWVKNITGNTQGLVYLDKSGIDMHSFEPTASDILTIAQADVLICIGGVSDEWVDAAVSSSQNENIRVIKLIEITGGLTEETVDGMQDDEDEHHNETDASEYDEHIWLSLKNAQKAVSAIAQTLSEINPENSELYLNNAKNYNLKLAELDKKYADAVASAEKSTLLFADRFPFRYLTEDYGIEYYAAFPGCSAESEASFETVTFLIEKTKELSLEYIIILESSDGKLADTVANETGADILTLDSCQAVTSEDVESGKTYLSVMEENLAILTEALS